MKKKPFWYLEKLSIVWLFLGTILKLLFPVSTTSLSWGHIVVPVLLFFLLGVVMGIIYGDKAQEKIRNLYYSE